MGQDWVAKNFPPAAKDSMEKLVSALEAALALRALADGHVSLALLTPGVMAGLGFYVVGTLLWLSALGRLELSQAYPFVSLGFALTTLGGWWLFSDQVSIQRVAGIAVIMVGIALVART